MAITKLRRALLHYAKKRDSALPAGAVEELAACSGVLEHLIEDVAASPQERSDLKHAKMIVDGMLADQNPESTGDTMAGMTVRGDALERVCALIYGLPDLPPAR
jgi:hypothetical protein